MKTHKSSCILVHHDIIVLYCISQAVNHKIRDKVIRKPLAKVQRLVVLCQLNKLNPEITSKEPMKVFTTVTCLPNIFLQPLVLVCYL